MSEWKKVDLGKLLEVKYGKDHKALNAGKIPCLGSGGLMRYVDKYLYNDESILIPRKGSLNNIMYQRNPFWTVDTMFWTIINKELVVPKFLFYQLTLIDYENLNVGSAVPSLTVPIINEIEVRIPSLSEQKFIASILSSLDDKIYLLHRQNATLEKMAETLFRQCFLEEAKDDWVNGKVSDLIKILSGFAFKSSTFVESGKYSLITIKGVQDGYLELNNADKIEELPVRMPDFCKLEIGDILLSLTGNVGRCCLVDTTDLLLNQRVAKLHPNNERDRAFTYFLFRQPQIKQLLEEMGKGTAQSNLSPIETSNMELIIPDIERLGEFAIIANPWLDKLLFNKKSIKTLTVLRDTLLPKLMNNEIKI